MNLAELVARRNALQEELDTVTAQIAEAVESQRRELSAILESVNGASAARVKGKHRRPKSLEVRARLSDAKKAWWAARRTTISNDSALPS